MKTLKTNSYAKSLAALKGHNAAYFARHPTEPWREVKLVKPGGNWAIVKLSNNITQ